MATLQYSVILLFMIMMMMILHSSAKIQPAMEGHFQTLHVGSLLPASDCHRSSTGSNKRQTVLELFHKHGPCSRSTSARPPLTDILSSDQSRVESIRTRLEHDSNTNKLIKNRTPYYKNNKSFKDAKTNLPIPPIIDSGDYMVTIGLGTPQRNLSLILDTGSGLTWTQCRPCIESCYKQNETIFDPSASSSYSSIPCDSGECSPFLDPDDCPANNKCTNLH
ncbi:hypothetical protein OROHE_008263 [Orobanche hederae]